MMRLPLAIALVLLPSFAHAQCFSITPSGKAYFQNALTAAEKCAARAEATRRSCSEATVHEATPGAINAELAKQLLPHIRGQLTAGAQQCQQTVRKQKLTKSRHVAKRVKPKPVVAIPLPRPRPVVSSAPPLVEPAPPEPEPVVIAEPVAPAPMFTPPPKPRGFLGWLRTWIK
ncbi:MAG: hypothetical protein LC750_00560 [Actinobacteria bacterium]|nr:hypothetical protein [Actinomycetota bacterium]